MEDGTDPKTAGAAAARASAGALRRFERSIRRRIELTQRFRRAVTSLPAVLQITVAATAAYAIAHLALGHAIPVVAVTVSITALGFARDARPRRVLETVVGILVGITLSAALVTAFGTGVWQLAFVLAATLVVARFFSPSAAFAVAAGVQSMLVVLLPAPTGGVFVRSLDGLIGGVLALVVTALVPRDPRGAARRDARRLVSTMGEALGGLVVSLETADEPAADLALTRLRRTQQLIDDWTQSLDTAVSVARISPFLRRHLPELLGQETLLAGLDLAARHLRVIARRVDFLVRDGLPRPVLAGLVGEIAEGIRSLTTDPASANEALSSVAHRLQPGHLPGEVGVPESVVIVLLRPLVVDLLMASGATASAARANLPEI